MSNNNEKGITSRRSEKGTIDETQLQRQPHRSEIHQSQQYFNPQTSFHVYKAAGVFCQDDIVTGNDKQEIQYYLRYPNTFFGGWKMTLSFGGKDGPALLRITTTTFSNKINIISIPDEITGIAVWDRKIVKRGFFTTRHEFVSLDGVTLFSWSQDGSFSNNLILTRKEAGRKIIVATWRKTSWAISKEGQLIISPGYGKDTMLILASALAMEEHFRELDQRRKKNRRRRMMEGHGGGGGGGVSIGFRV